MLKNLVSTEKETLISSLKDRLNSCVFKAARSKQSPHEYMLTVKMDSEELVLFEEIRNLIASSGYVERYLKYKYKYIIIGDYKYWICKGLYSSGFVLNRRLL